MKEKVERQLEGFSKQERERQEGLEKKKGKDTTLRRVTFARGKWRKVRRKAQKKKKDSGQVQKHEERECAKDGGTDTGEGGMRVGKWARLYIHVPHLSLSHGLRSI
jgi:hypothetical protein